MANNTVTIDVTARFQDEVSTGAKRASKTIDEIGKQAQASGKEVDKLSKKKAKPILDADDSRLLKKLRQSEQKAAKLGKTKVSVVLNALDKATTVIGKIMNSVNKFSGKTFQAILKLKDSDTLKTLQNVSDMSKKIAGKTWSAIVKVKDYATAPLTKIKNALFNIKTLVAAVTAGFAVKKAVLEPISLADQYSSAKIGFTTLLGESAGQAMMDQIDEFAKATPFKTSGVISNVQKMMAYGWDVDRVIEDMETIGDAAAATGKGDQGLESIVYALSEIRSKGKLSTQELNQLASAGIKAKAYLAEGLGYGTSDEGMAKLAKDLESGAIGANAAIEMILEGMKEFDGMMDKTANETVEGLKSQLEDTFEINIARRWGQGLQDGAKSGLGTVVTLLDNADNALMKFGDTVYDVGQTISNWAADKLENAVRRVTEITDSFEFQNASLGGKLKMLWKGVVADPFKEWFQELWSSEENVQKATEFGQKFAENLTKGILAVLGITDIFEDMDGNSESTGSNIAQGFAKGFIDGFDVSAITDKLVDAIGNVWGALPWWGKALVGMYGASQVGGMIGNIGAGISTLAGGAAKIWGSAGTIGLGGTGAATVIGASGLRGMIGNAGVAGVGASGILGGLSKAGYGIMGGTSALSVGGGTAALVGGASILGGAAGLASAGTGIYNLYSAHKAKKSGDKTAYDSNMAKGWSKIGGVATGAAIGSIFGPIGALVGAGVGGVAGWIGGNKLAKNIESAKFECEDLGEAYADAETEAEKLAVREEAAYNNLKNHFGSIKLSVSEIQRIASQITMGDATEGMDQFKSAASQAQASLSKLQIAADDTKRWMWKAGLGVKFNDDEKESIIQAFDDYISSAQSYVENKHYEFTTAVSLLVDFEEGSGKDILSGGDAYYSSIQEKLNSLGEELSGKVEIALQDGVITLDEQKEITNLQNQIAEITNKLADAEVDAKLETIKIKFGGEENISLESYQNLQSQLQSSIEEQMANYDDALTASITSLNLQLEDGAISQEEYDKQVQALTEGYEAKVEGMKVKAANLQLEILGNSYSDILGEDGMADLQHALQNAIDTGIDPIEWSDEKIADLLGVDQLGPETAETLRRALQSVIDTGVPDQVEKTVGVDITGEPEIMNQIDVMVEEFGIPKEKADTIALLLYGDKELLNQIDVSQLAAEFGIPESQAKTVIEKLTGEKSIENKINVIADDFGIPDVVNKTVKIKISGSVSSNGNLQSNYASKEAQLFGNDYRGGIEGASGLESFANGGMVRGGGKLIRVAEEGTPEMIIPLSSQRRDRGRRLWEKAGQMLEIPGFARGGMISGSQDEGIRFQRYEGAQAGDRNVQVDVGGIQVEIHIDATGHENIAEAIEAQKEEIAESVAGILADALSEQFENIPVRGGAA